MTMNALTQALAATAVTLAGVLLAAENTPPGPASGPTPLIDVTDLYHPPQDFGDSFDLIAAHALPEVDLKAVILDCTEPFRQPVAKNPGRGLFEDRNGPREPGFIPVLQLNYIFGRNVPSATCPFVRMKSVGDKMLDAPPFQQQGIELILATLLGVCARAVVLASIFCEPWRRAARGWTTESWRSRIMSGRRPCGSARPVASS